MCLLLLSSTLAPGVIAQGPPEGEALVRPGDFVVANLGSSTVSVFDGETGALRGTLGGDDGGLLNPTGVAFAPDGALYVSSSGNDRILRYDPVTGAFLGDFTAGGPLTRPFSLTFGPDGTLYVSSGGSVLRYGPDGAPLGAAASGMRQPIGLAFGADGLLYVASSSEQNVLRFDPRSGSPRGPHTTEPIPFVSDVVFGPDGALYVSSAGSGRVLRFGGGPGTPSETVAELPDGGVPMGLAFRGDDLLVGDFAKGRVFLVDPTRPGALREIVSEGLLRPENLAVRPPSGPPGGSEPLEACARPSVFGYGAVASDTIVWREATESGGVRRRGFGFESPDGGEVPSMLWEPSTAGPRPVVILAHGMPGTRRSLEHVALRYARAGALVISITAPYSRPDSPLRSPALFTIPHFDERDRTELVQYVRDVRRLVDLLPLLPGADPDQVVLVGHSYGGIVGAILAGVEPRIRAFALVAAPSGLRARFPGSWEDGDEPDVLGTRPLSSERWARRLADVDARCFLRVAPPDRLLLQFGRLDEIVPPDKARSLASAAPAGTAVRWYESGHEPTPEVWGDQVAWIARHVELDVQGQPGDAQYR